MQQDNLCIFGETMNKYGGNSTSFGVVWGLHAS